MQKSIKERPILFSAPMVRAILDGRKTQTRRTNSSMPDMWDKVEIGFYGDDFGAWFRFDDEGINRDTFAKCPYGKIGDFLWVRETFCEWDDGFVYAATCTDAERSLSKFKPSMFMPKRACRIRLEITNIRLERLKNITDKDCLCEGIDGGAHASWKDYSGGGGFWFPRDSFESLWESINGEGSWQANPWVWVVEFKVVK